MGNTGFRFISIWAVAVLISACGRSFQTRQLLSLSSASKSSVGTWNSASFCDGTTLITKYSCSTTACEGSQPPTTTEINSSICLVPVRTPASPNPAPTLSPDPINCMVNGQTVGQGPFNIRAGYTSATTTYPSTCESDSYQGSCTNGIVTYSHTPAAQACSPGIPANCNVNGQIVAQGTFNIRAGYTSATTDFPITCQVDSFQGSCENGVVTYTHRAVADSCTAGAPQTPRFRVVQDFGQSLFYDTTTKSIFRPRGVNYVHLNTTDYVGWHDTFDPRYYSAANAEVALGIMAGQGYNVVRITLDNPWNSLNLGGYGGRTLDANYVADVIDFLQRAANHGLLVNITQSSPPANYAPNTPNEMLYPDKIQARANYWHDLIIAIPANLRAQIFSIDVMNEAFFVTGVTWNGSVINVAPFDRSVSTFNYAGRNFDMTTATGRQQLMDAAATASYQTLKSAVKSVAPQILVTASVFAPASAGRATYDGLAAIDSATANQTTWLSGNSTAPLPAKAWIVSNTLDYLDLHMYQWLGARKDVQYFYDQLHSADIWENTLLPTPVVLGEFGATYAAYPGPSNLTIANSVLRQIMQASAKDFGFSGWIYYEWNDPTNQVWTAVDAANNLLLSAITPSSNPRVYSLPAGNFIAYNGIFASDGNGNYCHYDTPERYIGLGGNPDTSSLPQYTRIPASMTYGGVCGVWATVAY